MLTIPAETQSLEDELDFRDDPNLDDLAIPKADDSICWVCHGATLKRHCKIICTNCGFMRDCSDL